MGRHWTALQLLRLVGWLCGGMGGAQGTCLPCHDILGESRGGDGAGGQGNGEGSDSFTARDSGCSCEGAYMWCRCLSCVWVYIRKRAAGDPMATCTPHCSGQLAPSPVVVHPPPPPNSTVCSLQADRLLSLPSHMFIPPHTMAAIIASSEAAPPSKARLFQAHQERPACHEGARGQDSGGTAAGGWQQESTAVVGAAGHTPLACCAGQSVPGAERMWHMQQQEWACWVCVLLLQGVSLWFQV